MIATLLSYLPWLLLTLVLEGAIVVAAAPRGHRSSALRACLALNLLTHPTATLLSWRWHIDPLALALLEFLFEWLGYRQLLDTPTSRSLRLAFSANLFSGAVHFALWFGLLH